MRLTSKVGVQCRFAGSLAGRVDKSPWGSRASSTVEQPDWSWVAFSYVTSGSSTLPSFSLLFFSSLPHSLSPLYSFHHLHYHHLALSSIVFSWIHQAPSSTCKPPLGSGTSNLSFLLFSCSFRCIPLLSALSRYSPADIRLSTALKSTTPSR